MHIIFKNPPVKTHYILRNNCSACAVQLLTITQTNTYTYISAVCLLLIDAKQHF